MSSKSRVSASTKDLRVAAAYSSSFLRMKKTQLLLLSLTLLGAPAGYAQKVKTKTKGSAPTLPIRPDERWPAAKANTWYRAHSWLTGANSIPSTAVNQLEMWQAATFDPPSPASWAMFRG